MGTLPRILAGCLLAAYAAAAALPCGGDRTVAPARVAAAHEHGPRAPDVTVADAPHHGHGADHGGHGHAGSHHAPAPEPDPVAQWTAPCPCGCDGAAETAGSSSARVGWALAQRLPGLAGNAGTTDLALPALRAPANPLRGPEPIPI